MPSDELETWLMQLNEPDRPARGARDAPVPQSTIDAEMSAFANAQAVLS